MKVRINGLEVEAREGEKILDVANRLGIRIPTLCYLKNVYEGASCRICVVELGNGKLIPACAYEVSDGLTVSTDTPKIRESRRTTLELLLSAHRITCQNCPKKGECTLVELCSEYGIEGIPVCAECPLHGEDCFIARGEICLGPITASGCKAECIRDGRACEGCRGPVTRRDVIERARGIYIEHDISLETVLERLKTYCASSHEFDLIREYLIVKEVVKE
ncbi:MAG: 2Fe-2S iron-sulfur cluster-binding protein [Thaumarchaeota archaeon]|jgi:predicted molibdopterin-dependent oxidoreductase YjgC|nr:2Fe-2S iron-sulfur cluster-binding protein [Nitrososphaerota archaeon]